MRMGVHVGPVVTGVVGQTRPRFHVYGPAVLTAERMEHADGRGRFTAVQRRKKRTQPARFPFKPERAAVAAALGI